MGLCRALGFKVGVMYRDNGKENGNYYGIWGICSREQGWQAFIVWGLGLGLGLSLGSLGPVRGTQ